MTERLLIEYHKECHAVDFICTHTFITFSQEGSIFRFKQDCKNIMQRRYDLSQYKYVAKVYDISCTKLNSL